MELPLIKHDVFDKTDRYKYFPRAPPGQPGPPGMHPNTIAFSHDDGVEASASMDFLSLQVGVSKALLEPERVRGVFPETWLWTKSKTGYLKNNRPIYSKTSILAAFGMCKLRSH